MEDFARALRRAERELDVPEPQRSRLLLELAGDLEDLYRAYLDRGLSEEEARRRAGRWLELSPEAADVLCRLHTPALGRLLARFSGLTRTRLERGLVAALSLALVAGGLWSVSSADVLWPPGADLLAVLLVGGAGAWVAGGRALELWIRRSGPSGPGTSGRALRVASALPALPALPALAAAAVVVGGLGGAPRLYVALAAGTGGAAVGTAAWTQIARAAGAGAAGLTVGLLLSLIWHALFLRAASIRRARVHLDRVAGPIGAADGRDTASKEVA